MNYILTQWVIFFFIYCFFGWLWETSYVSLRKKKWVNRGFLNGPLIPIYGFGAIIVLLLTLTFKNNLVLIFSLGMIGATIIEYITGYALIKLFNKRYWNYSNQRLNINGHICLYTSLAWGFFSILLVKMIHPNIKHVVLNFPNYVIDIICIFLIIIFIYDSIKSTKLALSTKKVY
ncbi:MAG: putative ABC transporter permease [Bacilli bacterium]|nr:putative ABC transporter permease [Bacilli bacterium]MDD4406924.1 putative ABC transporter permease [Bacilli bacterium]